MLGILRRLSPEGISSSFAASYATGAAKLFMPQYELMAREIAAVASGAVLDIGTGPGIVPLKIGRLLPSARIVGVDISPGMVAIARKNQEESGLNNVSFLCMNGTSLEFPDQCMDMVISTDALHHWKKPVAVLNEMHRCLKAGGEAWVYDGFSGASCQDIRTCITQTTALSCWVWKLQLGVHGFSKTEYDTLVRRVISQSRFGSCVAEQRGIMMRLRLRKA